MGNISRLWYNFDRPKKRSILTTGITEAQIMYIWLSDGKEKKDKACKSCETEKKCEGRYHFCEHYSSTQ